MIIDVDDTVEIVDLKDYPPQFGLKEGQTGKIMSLFKYKGHAVAQVLPDDERRLKYNTQYRTYPLSLSRLVKVAAMLLALFLPCLAAAQDNLQVSKRPTANEVDTAKATIRAAQGSPTLLSYGGYAIVDIKLEGDLEAYPVPGSDDCLRTVSIPKGKGYAGWLVSKGETVARWVVIEPITTHDRLLVTGVANGTATVIWHGVVNGKSVIVAAFQFVIGKPLPPPVDPVDPVTPTNALALAAMADIKAGKGTVEDVSAYANLFLMYGTEIKNGKRFTVAADLNKEMNAKIDQLLGEDHKTLDSLRTAVGKELVAKIPSITNPSTKIADIKTALSETLLSIYKRLSEVK